MEASGCTEQYVRKPAVWNYNSIVQAEQFAVF